MRRILSQVVVLRASIAEARSARTGAGAALAVEANAQNTMGLYRILANPSEGTRGRQLRQWESQRRASGGPARHACRRKQNGTPCQN